ncbi:hypothetical protein [Halomontanus rarus]|uniref:hypothetical protein n=1 Tax=Halomontanus rarus TaxID=3034020 RepID=UPI0023E7E2C2|nr:hypothetical protein [Halovivax sp. TS33]
MIVRYNSYLGETEEIECSYVKEGENGMLVYDEYDNQIAYVKHGNFHEAVPDDEE